MLFSTSNAPFHSTPVANRTTPAVTTPMLTSRAIGVARNRPIRPVSQRTTRRNPREISSSSRATTNANAMIIIPCPTASVGIPNNSLIWFCQFTPRTRKTTISTAVRASSTHRICRPCTGRRLTRKPILTNSHCSSTANP